MKNKEDIKKGHRKRIMEKFLKAPYSFNKKNLLELMLFFIIPRKDTKLLAHNINEQYDSLLSLFCSDIDTLQKINGITENIILFIKFIYNIAEYLMDEKLEKKDVLNSMEDLVVYYKLKLGEKQNEEFRLMLLNAKNHIISEHLIATGSTMSVNVDLREILKKILNTTAVGVIIIHNHPSKNPTPSREDIDLTKQIKIILCQLTITLHDHIIIGGSDFFSFKRNNLL